MQSDKNAIWESYMLSHRPVKRLNEEFGMDPTEDPGTEISDDIFEQAFDDIISNINQTEDAGEEAGLLATIIVERLEEIKEDLRSEFLERNEQSEQDYLDTEEDFRVTDEADAELEERFLRDTE